MLKRGIGYIALISLIALPSFTMAYPDDEDDRNAIVTVETDIPIYLNNQLEGTILPAKVSLREWRHIATSSLVISADYASKFVLSFATWLISKKSAANYFKVPGYIEANGQITFLDRELCKKLQYYITDANRSYALQEDTHIEKVYLKNIVFVSDATQDSINSVIHILINLEDLDGKMSTVDLMDEHYKPLQPFNYYLLRYFDKSPLVFQPNDLKNDAISVFLMGHETESTYWVGILGEYYELLLAPYEQYLTLYQVNTSELALLTEKKAADYRPVSVTTHVLYPNSKVYHSMQNLLHTKPQKKIQLRSAFEFTKNANDMLQEHFSKNFYHRHNHFYMDSCVSDFLLDVTKSFESMSTLN